MNNKIVEVHLYKRLYLLNGLAILCVVINHAARWGQIAMMQWTHQYQSIIPLGYSLVGSWVYYVLLILRQFTVFGVAAFLFTAGCFIAYADRGTQSKITWKFVSSRVTALFIPFLIWSIVIFVEQYFVDKIVYTPIKYVWIMFTSGADGPYYFIPLLCYFYLLSPILTRLARNHYGWLLALAVVFQFGAEGLRYLSLGFGNTPILDFLIKITPYWSLPHWVLFYCIGLFIGYRMEEFKTWVVKKRNWLVGAVVIFGLAAIIEPELVYQLKGVDWTFPLPFSTIFYSFAAVFFFLTLKIENSRLFTPLYYLGGRTFGIYILHSKTMEVAARSIYHLAPNLLAYQLPLALFLVGLGLGAPLLIMLFISRTPVRQYYRYLFG